MRIAFIAVVCLGSMIGAANAADLWAEPPTEKGCSIALQADDFAKAVYLCREAAENWLSEAWDTDPNSALHCFETDRAAMDLYSEGQAYLDGGIDRGRAYSLYSEAIIELEGVVRTAASQSCKATRFLSCSGEGMVARANLKLLRFMIYNEFGTSN